MHQIRSQAYKFLMKNKVELPVTKAELERVIESRGWQIMSYSEAEPLFAANDRVAVKKREAGEEHLSLRGYAAQHDAFALIGDLPIIFYRESLGQSQMLEAIAHEIGHLALSHTHHLGLLGKSNDREKEKIQEKEADEFAYELLAPQPVLRHCHIESPDDIVAIDLLDEDQAKKQYGAMGENRRYRCSALEAHLAHSYRRFIRHANYSPKQNLLARCVRYAAVFGLAGILIFGGIGAGLLSGQGWGLPTGQSIQGKALPGQVAVTKSGECYHQPGCSYAGGAIAYLDLSEAEARGYRPCSHCSGWSSAALRQDDVEDK